MTFAFEMTSWRDLHKVHPPCDTSFDAVNKKLEHVLQKLSPMIDYSDCKTEEEKALKSIQVLAASANVVKEIKDVEKSMGELKEALGNPSKKKAGEKRPVTETMNSVRSVKEISEKFPEF